MACISSGSWRLQIRKFYFILFQVSICFLLLVLPATSLSFNFPSFNVSVWGTALKQHGDAIFSGTIIDLTDNREASTGRVLYNAPVTLWDKKTGSLTNFTTHFSFTIGKSKYTKWSADGLAFFLAPYGSIIEDIMDKKYGAHGYGGGGLGLFYDSHREIKNPIVAVEFDTNGNRWDPDSNHIGIDIYSIVSVCNSSCNGSLLNLMRNNGIPWEATVTYDSSSHNLSVIFSCSNKTVSTEICSLNYIVDLKMHLPDKVTIGFSSTTGSSVELHQLHSWDFSSSLEIDESNTEIGMVVGLAVGGVAMITGLFFFLKRRNNQENEAEDELVLLDVPTVPREFTYSELAGATSNFDEKQKLGQGGFGGVYRGFLSDLNIDVAVKRISKGSTQGMEEYASEVKIISRLRHRNLVHLVGWCHQRKELLLVYEFMPNGSLDSYLFRNRGSLAWELRYRIALDLASALQYLHEGWNQCVIHRDIKSSNVILDSNFTAKLGDFGLARLVDNERASQARTQTTTVAGTLGYMAPEYVITGKASKDSDVYSFGIVLLEIACGRKAIEEMVDPGERSLVEWVWELYKRGKHLEAADPSQGMDSEKPEIEYMIVVGLWCAKKDYNLRPSIGQAINVLKFDAPLPILPFHWVPVPSPFSIISSHGSTKCDASHTQRLSSNSSAIDLM